MTNEMLLHTNKIALVAHTAAFVGVLVLFLSRYSVTNPHTVAQTLRYTIAGPSQIGPSGCNSDPTGTQPGVCNTTLVFAPPENMFSFNVIYCVLFYFAFTALSHLYYSTNAFGTGKYLRDIRNGWNPHRWLEYGISASIMSVLIGYSVGVNDVFLLSMFALVTAAMQACGYVTEASLVRGLKPNLPVIQGAFVAGWILYASLWIPILFSFYFLVTDVNDKYQGIIDPNTNKDVTVPYWVYFVVIVEFIQYALFGLIQRWQVKAALGSTGYTYAHYEMNYLKLSFVAKFTLAAALSYGVLWNTRTCPV